MNKTRVVALSSILIILALIGISCQPSAPQEIVSTPKEIVTTKEIVVEKTVEVMITPTPEPEGGVVRVGIAMPMSGANAYDGYNHLKGVETALKIINESHPEIDLPFAETEGIPGLNNAKLEIIVGDHQAVPEKGASEAERLITTKDINLLCCYVISGATSAAQPVAEKYGIPFFTTAASSAALQEQGLEWWFRTGPSDLIYGVAMFDYLDQIKDEVGISSVAFLYEDTIFGQDSAKIMRNEANKRGYAIAEDIQYQRETSTLDSEVLRLKSANPDVLLITSYQADAILLYNTMQQLDYIPKLMFAQGGSPGTPSFVSAVGDLAEGLITRGASAPELWLTGETATKVAQIYKDLAGIDMPADPPLQIQGMLVIADILNRAGSTDPEAIRKAALETNIPPESLLLPWGGVTIDPTTHANPLVKPVLRQLQSGNYCTLWPSSVAACDLKYPLTPWSDR